MRCHKRSASGSDGLPSACVVCSRRDGEVLRCRTRGCGRAMHAWCSAGGPPRANAIWRCHVCRDDRRRAPATARRAAAAAAAAEEADDDDDTVCAACGRGDAAEVLLLCDGPGCGRAMHTHCCVPRLSAVPEGRWFCNVCESAGGATGAVGAGDAPASVAPPPKPPAPRSRVAPAASSSAAAPTPAAPVALMAPARPPAAPPSVAAPVASAPARPSAAASEGMERCLICLEDVLCQHIAQHMGARGGVCGPHPVCGPCCTRLVDTLGRLHEQHGQLPCPLCMKPLGTRRRALSEVPRRDASLALLRRSSSSSVGSAPVERLSRPSTRARPQGQQEKAEALKGEGDGSPPKKLPRRTLDSVASSSSLPASSPMPDQAARRKKWSVGRLSLCGA
eukprot:TRINITY_DN4423_c0_g1_i1.p2 TRINITY_DN4423_c0_g1~~TRINITY_DN4423_c0_g1_i1.p2  ORF type:complete len:409 (-),score=83.60 TRINITY_DN4423_c0_g1_i1:1657-2832(-)